MPGPGHMRRAEQLPPSGQNVHDLDVVDVKIRIFLHVHISRLQDKRTLSLLYHSAVVVWSSTMNTVRPLTPQGIIKSRDLTCT